ncbi:hypothetical protein N9986_03655 [Akkermansiaceae bacterium]|nr:hypothetical protein [Akkermansiaceae bacterium]
MQCAEGFYSSVDLAERALSKQPFYGREWLRDGERDGDGLLDAGLQWVSPERGEQFLKWRNPQRKTGRYESLKEFHEATKYEEHGLEVDYDIFENAGPPKEGERYAPEQYDLRLKSKAICVDAGVVIKQVTDRFSGKGPDLGCYELGEILQHYGPRPK